MSWDGAGPGGPVGDPPAHARARVEPNPRWGVRMVSPMLVWERVPDRYEKVE